MKFGRRVRQLREEREMHLSDLAKAMGWSSVFECKESIFNETQVFRSFPLFLI